MAERPFELIRLLASPGVTADSARAILKGSAAPGAGFGAAGPLLRDPLALALAFGALPATERDLVTALATLIAGPGGRSVIAPEKAASALAHAAASMLGRPGGQGLAARWLGEMLRSASLSERAALRRLIASRWPGKGRQSNVLAALGLELTGKGAARPTPAPKPGTKGSSDALAAHRRGEAPADKGSIAWLVLMLRDRPPGYARLLRRLLRSGRARETACRALPETLLVRLLAAIAPDEARSLLSAAELIARALEGSGGGGKTRAAFWNALLAVAAKGSEG